MQTELTVVNALLKVIGESPVNEVDLSHPDVRSALEVWEEISAEVQARGWWYNVETWDLPVETNGEIKVPSNTVAITPDDPMYIKRGNRLYNKETHSFDFSDQDTITVDLITNWDIDEMPPTMYNYVLAEARARMLMEFAMDANKLQKYTDDAVRAFHLLQVQHLKFSNVTATGVGLASVLLNSQRQGR